MQKCLKQRLGKMDTAAQSRWASLTTCPHIFSHSHLLWFNAYYPASSIASELWLVHLRAKHRQLIVFVKRETQRKLVPLLKAVCVCVCLLRGCKPTRYVPFRAGSSSRGSPSCGRLNTKRAVWHLRGKKRSQAGDLNWIAAGTTEEDAESGLKQELTDICVLDNSWDDMISHVEDAEADELINELVLLSVKERKHIQHRCQAEQNAFIKGNVSFCFMLHSYLFILNGEKDAWINVIVFSFVTDYILNLCATCMYMSFFIDKSCL